MSFKMLPLEGFDPDSLKRGDEVNVICGTSIGDLIEPIFGPSQEEELILLAPEEIGWPHLLTRLQCFPSSSQAVKNWRAQKRNPMIEPGFNGPLIIGKARKISIWVWKVIPECTTT